MTLHAARTLSYHNQCPNLYSESGSCSPYQCPNFWTWYADSQLRVLGIWFRHTPCRYSWCTCVFWFDLKWFVLSSIRLLGLIFHLFIIQNDCVVSKEYSSHVALINFTLPLCSWKFWATLTSIWKKTTETEHVNISASWMFSNFWLNQPEHIWKQFVGITISTNRSWI